MLFLNKRSGTKIIIGALLKFTSAISDAFVSSLLIDFANNAVIVPPTGYRFTATYCSNFTRLGDNFVSNCGSNTTNTTTAAGATTAAGSITDTSTNTK